MSVEELRDQLRSGYQPENLRFMAALATRKFRLIRTAADCMLAGIGLLILAGLFVITA